MTEVLHIAGRIGRDAQIRRTQGGEALASFSIAVDRRKGGEKITQWYDATMFGDRGEKLAPYLTKGTVVSAHGLPGARVHEGKIYMQITVRDIALLGGGRSSDDRSGGDYAKASGGRAGASDIDDDIPF